MVKRGVETVSAGAGEGAEVVEATAEVAAARSVVEVWVANTAVAAPE